MGELVSAEFGNIALAAGGTYSSKPRPVLIFQNSAFSTGESTVVIPFTSEENPDIYYRVPVSATNGNGLGRDCWLEIDKVSAIRTSWLGPTIGKLEMGPLTQAVELSRQLMSPSV